MLAGTWGIGSAISHMVCPPQKKQTKRKNEIMQYDSDWIDLESNDLLVRKRKDRLISLTWEL